MDPKLLLDALMMLLLAAVLAYAVLLNRQLGMLRKNRDDLAKLITHFNEATVRAESSIPKLRKAADEAGLVLADRVEKAHALRDDLAFMIERADTMATRLEASVRTARSESKATPRPAAAPSAGTAAAPAAAAATSAGRAPAVEDSDDERSEAERQLLRALQSVR